LRTRIVLAVLSVAAFTCLTPAAIAAAHGHYYPYGGHDSSKPEGIISLITFSKDTARPRIAMDYYSHCGEFTSGWMPVTKNGFGRNVTFSNGFGFSITAHFNHSQAVISGSLGMNVVSVTRFRACVARVGGEGRSARR